MKAGDTVKVGRYQVGTLLADEADARGAHIVSISGEYTKVFKTECIGLADDTEILVFAALENAYSHYANLHDLTELEVKAVENLVSAGYKKLPTEKPFIEGLEKGGSGHSSQGMFEASITREDHIDFLSVYSGNSLEEAETTRDYVLEALK